MERDPRIAELRRAIVADPANAPPLRLRLGLALIAAERLVEAIAELEALTRDVPQSPSAWQALGAARRMADDVPRAGAAFDRVLALRPADPLARLSRAQVAADLGRPAVAFWREALAADPASGPARIALAAALAGDARAEEGEAMLRDRLAKEPAWTEGWTALASLIHRWHGPEAFAATARAMFDAGPRNPASMLAAIRLLARAGEHRQALAWVAEARARAGDSAPLQLAEAEALDESGHGAAAGAIFDGLAQLGEPTVELARIRQALRMGAPDRAAVIAEHMPDGAARTAAWPYLGTAWRLLDDPRWRMPDGAARTAAWPYLGTAWQLLDDPRWRWLEGDERLVGGYDIGLSASELAALAERLRALHSARHAPFEQSMRGGTQTEGWLLSREEPELRRLRAALTEAVAAHIAQLPPRDPRHPTLGQPRSRFRFVGSWSVRLVGGGHHVNHVHGEGWLSSACHIVVPSGNGGALTLGEPPRELGLDLPPVRAIRPVAGRVVLFPSTMWHGTTAFGAGERLTVAFDVRPLV